ncbi:MAG: sodium:calcium antiporter [Planctomycetota bacterium]|nr:MAG: sodium:calcium antiporter [Planctomycetota bacterium]REJ90633.1 MAG: sodium:calcium antiporter [Planctomycetota bacterium]REK24803.1 MAG: sodium:calcium antiporter [Planctomycetota bacterium]REK38832.1 MAG: sodium:calcium antiporter [Planctomycetota bacterium]
MVLVLLIFGLAALFIGAELLVRGASRLAVTLGLSPLVVGLTVVAYGTSAPEFVVSVQSTLAGQPDVALANVIGSNIFNVLVILGISAVIIPLRVSQQILQADVPLMVALSIVLMGFSIDGRLGRLDGAFLTAGLLIYTVWVVNKGRKVPAGISSEVQAAFRVDPQTGMTGQALRNGSFIIAGLGCLILGSHWFVESAITMARYLGVSELVIGLTIVAAGTSLPEVATSITAALRGERDIAVANVIGSNLFNMMGVVGTCSLLAADGVAVSETAFRLDFPVMIAAAVACLPIFFTGHVIARWEGGVFVAYYVAYIGYLILSATASEWTRTFGTAMLGFVVPLTVITLATGVFRAVLRRNHAQLE